METTTVLSVLGVIAIACCAVCGLLAIIAPKLFDKVACFWGTWVTTRPTVPYLDTRVDIDQFVLRRTRLFGWLVVGLTIFCAVTLIRM